MQRKPFTSLIGIITVFSCWFFAWTQWNTTDQYADTDATQQERQRGTWEYTFINPLIECEIATIGSQQKYIPFERDLKKKIQETIIASHSGIEISLYFRNLRNGPWFGINEESDYAPASLMKLPIVISYLKWVEQNPNVWNFIFTWAQEDRSVPSILPEQHITPGEKYTIDELIHYSLIYSDNDANRTLLNNISAESIYKVFLELGIPIIDKIEKWTSDYISVKEYASFFRVLYNSSYLSRTWSEYILSIMSNAQIQRWIHKYLPSTVKVSHKFGERWYTDPKTGKLIEQFHDCGIVYYEKYPYLLCVMTKWETDIENLESIVEDIGKTVYDTISTLYH